MPITVANEGFKFQSSSNNNSSSSGSSGSRSSSNATSPATPPPTVHHHVNVDLVDAALAAMEVPTGKRTGWQVQSSFLARHTHNMIRGIVESLKMKPNPEKPMIPLSIGDPTIFGNLKASDETMKAVLKAVEGAKFNGYAGSMGHDAARQAIAKYSAHQRPDMEISPNDVVITSGCSAALEMCILALADRGQNVLVPRPGFCLYKTLAEGMNIEIRYYDLLPDQEWRADLKQMESLIDENTAALLINNPGNPCGSVYDADHLKRMIDICERHYLPIIADEIYEHFVFPDVEYVAISSLTHEVPVLTCGGLTKRFLVPGWRTGWVIVHDRKQRLGDAVNGLKNLCGRILGSNTIVQGALPDILVKTPQSYFDGVIELLHSNALMAYRALKKVRGLNPVMPKGAMYMMIGISIEHFPALKDDVHFVQEMVNEQSVFCLPGSCFQCPNFIRIVLTVPAEMIEESCVRIAEFCELHYKKDTRAFIEHSTLLDGSVNF
ncbi:tyrosine aminotransferase [Scaptodrosophila lebanonensis]|uniref:Tyrosine aminotransferase n=1 Tax=Drosophila lebanonensis TaxID=7225 RepID=A0A6J2U421_DROLE|nr:tyrosine aminotransferase [Scaptodrosophila lebanonensis]